MNNHDLEERLIKFSVAIVDIEKKVQNTKSGKHLSNQLIRSGTSVALNYGEAQSAESRKDFIHKIKIVLKELRETFICLKILSNTNLYKPDSVIENVKTENNELISIFVKSVETAKKNLVEESR